MARQKQAAPLRREISSEYTSSADRSGTPTKRARNLDTNVMATPMKLNGHANGKVAAASPAVPQKKQAGLMELATGVLGIYVSLYVPSPKTVLLPSEHSLTSLLV